MTTSKVWSNVQEDRAHDTWNIIWLRQTFDSIFWCGWFGNNFLYHFIATYAVVFFVRASLLWWLPGIFCASPSAWTVCLALHSFSNLQNFLSGYFLWTWHCQWFFWVEKISLEKEEISLLFKRHTKKLISWNDWSSYVMISNR